MAPTTSKNGALVTSQSRPPIAEWEGRGTIAYVSKLTKQNFQNLPSEVHRRLQQAAIRLSEENSVPRVLLQGRRPDEVSIDSSSMPTIERYELARFQVDHPTRGMDSTPSPRDPPDSRRPPQHKRKIDPRDLYMMHLGSCVPLWKASQPHLHDTESFRAKVAETGLAAIKEFSKTNNIPAEQLPTALRCFGSYLSGFALPDSHLDTLMELDCGVPSHIRTQLPIVLVRAFLDAGLCAALARGSYGNSAMLKVCQNANPDLVQTLKNKYDHFAGGSHPKTTEFSNIYFPESLGIQCHIHFLDNNLMYHTSNLMRCYHLCDERVAQMALVIKKWAKMRNIADPAKGTLSSYGYMLMLLHYLLHVVYPPVVPNLQYSRIDKHQHLSADNSYWSNTKDILAEARAGNLTVNRQSLASLLRGFFAYYSPQSKSVRCGHLMKSPFIWKSNVVSLGSEPRLFKSEKGWAPKAFCQGRSPKWNFLAIEDPFNRQHNVAEQLRPQAVSLLRDEFVRAHTIICRTQLIPGTGWEWRTNEGTLGDDLMAFRNPTCSELDWVDQPFQNHHSMNPRNGNATSRPRPTHSRDNGPIKTWASVASASAQQTQTASAVEPSSTADIPSPSSNQDDTVGQSHAETNTEATEDSFQLDPMQLRDIKTILAGGNGCRR